MLVRNVNNSFCAFQKKKKKKLLACLEASLLRELATFSQRKRNFSSCACHETKNKEIKSWIYAELAMIFI